ncbi:taste receptor type 1 member 1 [Paroedura picta]|uniref:taste receptor type 1 member 1 n=1 Tax=Paroedura picta TaxID=143630 RepID=UPI0040575F6A
MGRSLSPFLSPLSVLVLFGCISSARGLPSPLRKDGDYTIAGLFQIHRITAKMESRPEVGVCASMGNRSRHSYYLAQAMRFSIAEINNASHLLPNVTLGYDIYDTCSQLNNLYATLSLLSQGAEGCHSQRHLPVMGNYTGYQPKAVAVIGPDSSEFSLITAGLLGIFLMPEISYESTSPMLSQKRAYPSFLRTIPSDHLQAEALVSLLKAFRWTWVAAVGSDNTYGRQGLQTLHEVATTEGICFAYQGVISMETSSPELPEQVQAVLDSKTEVAVLFANKHGATVFFREVLRQNASGKVWLGTEDWSLSREIWGIHGIRSIGTVIGVTIMQGLLPEMWAFEAASRHSESHGDQASCFQGCREACSQLCSQLYLPPLEPLLEPSPYDTQAAFNVYLAVYAVAHSLHGLLGCQTGVCRKEAVYPWQLLKEVKEVNFSVQGRQIYFDSNGDPLIGYDIVQWKWADREWRYDVIATFSSNPSHLTIYRDKLQWHTEDNQVPVSVCSKECAVGEQKVLQGTHQCCFHCVACPSGTFLNKSNPYTCQMCRDDQWSPAASDACFLRAIIFLQWSEGISQALLSAVTLLLLLLAGALFLFVRKANTPVVKSAGGWLCFVMLCALAGANLSLYCYFGVPSTLTCLLRVSLYTISFSVCLACMAARSFQILLIFKMATKAPGLHEAWKNHHGCSLFIGACTGLQGVMFLSHLCTTPPFPHNNYEVADQVILLECKSSSSVVPYLGLLCNGLLGTFCFVVSYMGKDLPNSYNEAKCTTFSLIIYFVSLICYFTTISIYAGKYLPAIHVASLLFPLYGIFGSYFVPKVYIILFRSELNTNEHFQMSIQSYTKKKNVRG